MDRAPQVTIHDLSSLKGHDPELLGLDHQEAAELLSAGTKARWRSWATPTTPCSTTWPRAPLKPSTTPGVLAECFIATSDLPLALEVYEAMRKDRAEKDSQLCCRNQEITSSP